MIRSKSALAYLVGVSATWLIATTAFVFHRNHEHSERELGRARAAAVAVARGQTPLCDAIAFGIVAAPRPSKYPFLKVRRLVGPDGARPLGGPSAKPEDKILADAATAAEREDHLSPRFLPDGTGQIVATAKAPSGIAVVLARPLEAPAPYPLFVIGGLLMVSGLLTWAGRRIGSRAEAGGLALGLSLWAIPTGVWGGPAFALLIVLVAGLISLLNWRGHVASAALAFRRHRVAYAYLLPAALGMAVLVVVPFLVGCVLGFFDHSRGEWQYVGFRNFAAILGGDGRSFTDPLNFWFTLSVTLAWTAVNVALHVTLGIALALALNERWVKGRGMFRMLLILPWAVPNYITALIWRGMFQSQFGAVNALLFALGLDKVSWFSQFATAFSANVVTNTWLGFPFMMVVALGALQAIPRELYEAAAVDGATPWQRFTHITLPGLRPALLPAVILGSIWTFNMFNVIYLVSGGKPAGATDILVTQAYRWAFERGQRYGMAAAYATIIFLILVGWTLLANRVSKEKAA